MLVNVRVAMTMLAMVAVLAKPDLKHEFYDAFNDTTSIARSGGKVLIRCVPTGRDLCEGVELELVGPGNDVKKSACDPDVWYAVFRLNIDENMALGDYKCRDSNGQESKPALTLGYRTCTNRESFQANCSENTFCLVKSEQPGKLECVTTSPSKCNAPSGTKICPAVVESLCHAIPMYENAFAKFHQDTCPTTSSSSPIADFAKTSYDGIDYRYAEPIKLIGKPGEQAKFDILIPPRSTLENSKLTCVAKKRDGTVVSTTPAASIKLGATHDLEHLFDYGTNVFKLLCDFSNANSDQVLASLENYLVVHVPTTVTIKDKKGPSGKPMMWIVLDPSPSDDFTWETTWFKDGNRIATGEKHDEQEEQGPGKYEVEVILVFYSAAPARRIHMDPIKSGLRVVKPETTSTRQPTGGPETRQPGGGTGTATDTATKKKDDDDDDNDDKSTEKQNQTLWEKHKNTIIGTLSGIGALIALTVIVVVAVCCVKKRKKHPDETHKNRLQGETKKEDKQLLDDAQELKQAANERGAMNEVDMNDYATDRIKKLKDSKLDSDLAKFDQKAADEEQEEFEEGGTVKIPHCRHEVPFKKSTLVICTAIRYKPDGTKETVTRLMPINRMGDFYGNNYMIAMAPLKSEFFYQWQTIRQEDVGVLVWVGELVSQDGNPKIDQYAPFNKGQKMKFGDVNDLGRFTITAVSDPSSEQGCETIVLEVVFEQMVIEKINRKTRSKMMTDRRRISFQWFKNWPDHEMAKDLAGLSRGISQIAAQQVLRASKGLRGVMIHCSLGMQRSISLTICYFGRQMWLEKGVVNPMAILRYIRRRRMYALGITILRLPERINQQMAMVAAVLQVICTRSTYEEVGDHGRALTGGQSILNQLAAANQPKAICPVPKKPSKDKSEKSSKPGTSAMPSKRGQSINSRR